MGFWAQVGLQEATSVLGMELVGLHDHMMFFFVLTFSFVGWTLLKLSVSKVFGRFYLDNDSLESVWIFLPFIVLVCLGLPSVKLLYLMDDVGLPESSVKVIGHQWYWTYEYTDMRGSSYSYDSYMLKEEMLEDGDYRLLEVDNRCVVPRMVSMRSLVSSSDVIHSWAIPSAGVKVDAVPGRVNQVSVCFLRSGVFYGQCSELCGVNHSFMPICVECVSVNSFSEWILNNHDYMLSKKLLGSGWGVFGAIFKVIGAIFKGVCYLVSLYFTYLYYVFYYMMVVPVKYVVVTSWSVLWWSVKTSFALLKWLWWFTDSPFDALIFAFWHVGGIIFNVVLFVLMSPVKAVLKTVKGIYSGVVGLLKVTLFLFEAILFSMSSFTSDSFKEYVMSEVNYNTKKFIWNLCEHYNFRR
uniref:Cytochrome c oxidase subunit 2 n=1 Tax=Physunio superbus TaxID=2494254 RepID=A0A8A3WFS5_9BIVA|nr:cytochrome c oxidase subunit 2 [Physunio superbus]